jgi:hypothetical protein
VIIAYCFSAIIGGALTIAGFWPVFGLAPALVAAPFGASLLAAAMALWIELRRQRSTDERPPVESSGAAGRVAKPESGKDALRSPAEGRARGNAGPAHDGFVSLQNRLRATGLVEREDRPPVPAELATGRLAADIQHNNSILTR